MSEKSKLDFKDEFFAEQKESMKKVIELTVL